jgi:acyl-CoA thioester hydrolase
VADGRGQQVGKAFERAVDIRWRDTDALGHVNHAVFLTYLEEGRDAFFTQALTTDPAYVVARIELDFRAEIQLADRRVTVTLEVENVGTTSLTTRETITLPSGEKAAEARVTTVRWDTGQHKPAAFTDAERRQLAGYT